MRGTIFVFPVRDSRFTWGPCKAALRSTTRLAPPLFLAAALTGCLATTQKEAKSDCWLLDEESLAAAQATGQCHDAFQKAGSTAEDLAPTPPLPDPSESQSTEN
ncbi:MAG: hypothetical protein AAF530_09125 [Pseudomonadota bacterium]